MLTLPWKLTCGSGFAATEGGSLDKTDTLPALEILKSRFCGHLGLSQEPQPESGAELNSSISAY